MNSDFEENHENPVRALKSGLFLGDLTKGVEFEFKDEEPPVSSEDDYFDREEVLKHLNFDCIDDGSDEENDRSPFEKLQAKMFPLMDNKGVYKMIVKSGAGIIVPENSIVTIHYSCYLEYSGEPFDSTHLQGRPRTFRLGMGGMIPGLDIAISSMKKGEISKFLIQPKYAFGRMGCPPRIPPAATILCQVELVNVLDNMAAYEYEQLSPEDQRNMTFEQVLAVCKAGNQTGNNYFNNKDFKAALRSYRKAIKILEEQPLSNEEEQEQQTHLLVKLYQNASTCYSKEQDAVRAASSARRALQLEPNSAKAMYCLGKAYRLQNNFTEARKFLKLARNRSPNNQDVVKELINLDKQEARQKILEKEFCKRMFQSELREKNKDLVEEKSSD